jgi:hypothetical protein
MPVSSPPGQGSDMKHGTLCTLRSDLTDQISIQSDSWLHQWAKTENTKLQIFIMGTSNKDT